MVRLWIIAGLALLASSATPGAATPEHDGAVCVEEDAEGKPSVTVGSCGYRVGYDAQRQVVFVCLGWIACMEIHLGPFPCEDGRLTPFARCTLP